MSGSAMLLSVTTVFILSLVSTTVGNRCGLSGNVVKRRVHARIIGGIRSQPGAWPWLVALAASLGGPTEQMPDFICGGSLISPRHVLTAAHCSAEKIYLCRLGTHDLRSKQGKDVLVDRFIVHPHFDANKAFNDIGLVVLKTRVKYSDMIRPICLPVQPLFHASNYLGTYPYVAGWGDTVYGANRGSVLLKEVQVPIVPLQRCKVVYKKYETNVTNKNICAGYFKGGKDSCQGDSGGPLMLRSGPRGNRYFVIGVISHGHGCGFAQTPGVFSRVSEFTPWILQEMAKTRLKPIPVAVQHPTRLNTVLRSDPDEYKLDWTQQLEWWKLGGQSGQSGRIIPEITGNSTC